MESLLLFSRSDPGVKPAGRGTPVLGGRLNTPGYAPGSPCRSRKNQLSPRLCKQKNGPDGFWFRKAAFRMDGPIRRRLHPSHGRLHLVGPAQ